MRHPNTTLPTPSPAEVEHSRRLRDYIVERIRSHGSAISFAEYMHQALYAPGLGYYSAGLRKFGPGGDFITAPEISPLFSRCIARFVEITLATLQGGDVLEVGPGTGRMACDMWSYWRHRSIQPANHFMLEVSAELRERQRAVLVTEAPDIVPRADWLDDLPCRGFRGVVVVNEVLDAMPVHLFVAREDVIKERFVCEQGEGLGWQEAVLTEGPVRERVQALTPCWHDGVTTPREYRSEVNLAMEAWLARVAGGLDQGVVVILDYGYPRREYYHSQRAMGTLRCYYRHRVHDDPLVYPGLQDITASVDFTALAETAVRLGLDMLGFSTQAHFLLAAGLGDMLVHGSDDDAPRVQLERAHEAKKLLMPGEMGELVKVLILGKNITLDASAWRMFDLRHKL